ncbi:helix-turn-helix domain-containing protein [Bradyrhizobium pachyrhizi]|uniref:helix-turn-helix domain-containing protein n=1 Tax=Bradyrhizobium pachyrhizi TaxID=280333 RepID=UPI003D36E7FC
MSRSRDDTTPLKNPSTFKARDAWISAVLAADLPHATARVAAAIAMHLNVESGQCNPGYPTLALASSISERSVYRHVELLERAGWVEVERTTGHASQLNLLTPANSMAGVTEPTTANSMAGVPLPNSAVTPAKTGLNPCHTVAEQNSGTAKRTARRVSPPPAGKTRRERETARARRDAAEAAPPDAARPVDAWTEFAALWDRGHADDQRKVRKAFERAVDAHGVEPVMASARAWAASREARFLPDPLQWLVDGWRTEPAAMIPHDRSARASRRHRQPDVAEIGKQIEDEYREREEGQ